MKRLLFLVLLGAMGLLGYSQTKTIYLPLYGQSSKSVPTQVTMNISQDLVLVNTLERTSPDTISNLFAQQNLQISPGDLTDLGGGRSFLCPLPSTANINVLQLVAALSQEPQVGSANYFLYNNDPQTLSAPLHEIFFRLKPTTTRSQAEFYLGEYGTSLLKARQNGIEKHSIGKSHDPVDVCTALYETGLFEFCEPNKRHIGQLYSAADYSADQWYINSAGATADTKVDDAWAIPGANHGEGVVVAIVDEGVQYYHWDFSGSWVTGYDALPPELEVPRVGPPGSIQNHQDAKHGTCVAGLVAADNDGTGITGVAYESKIMPVRISYKLWWISEGTWTLSDFWDDDWCADGIETAHAMGADIINCSWKYGVPSSVINEAITDAVTSGRGGLGIPVLFSSGNDYAASVANPANHPLAIAVGATDKSDQRASFSNYGNQLDIVAPGVSISTTDITGYNDAFDWDDDGILDEDQGYNGTGALESDYADLNYTNKFSGTSAAAPIASGVMALILSNNPGLTEEKAREILETTCYKIPAYSFSTLLTHPNGTWNNQVGYGRIDAFAAVQRAIELAGGTGLGWGGTSNITLEGVWQYKNVCFDRGDPAYIKWSAKAYHPFENEFGDRYLSNGLVESSPLLSTEIHGFGYGTYMTPGDGYQFLGDNTAALNLSGPSFFDVISPTFPVSVDMQLQLGTDPPVDGPEDLTHDFTVEMRGIKIVLDAEEASICDGSTYSLTYHVSGTGSPLFSWQRKVGDAWENITFPTDYPIGGVQTFVSSEYEAGENMYRIRAENEEGCIIKSDTFKLFVSSPAFNELDFDACYGSMEVPLDLEISGGLEPYSVNWSPGIHLSDPTAETPIFDPTSATTTDYSVTVTDALGCTETATAHVEVHPYGTLDVFPHATPDVVCFGGDSKLSSSGISGIGLFNSWTWSLLDGTVLQTGPSNTSYNVIDLETTTTFTRTVIDRHNCRASADVTVTVDPGLNPVVTLDVDPGTHCHGEAIDVTSTVSGGVSPYSYLWDNGETTPTIGATGESASLVVTDDEGCESNEATIAISRLPAIAIMQVNHANPGDAPQPWGTPYTEAGEDHTPAEINLCPGDIINTGDHFNFYNGSFANGTAPYTQVFSMTYAYYLPFEGDAAFEHTIELGASFPSVTIPDGPEALGLPSGAVVTESWLRVRISDAAGCVFPAVYEAPADLIHFTWSHKDLNPRFSVTTSVCDQLYGITACIHIDPGYQFSQGPGDKVGITVIGGPEVDHFDNIHGGSSGSIDEFCFRFHEAGFYTITVEFETDCGSVSHTETVYLHSAWPVVLDEIICDLGDRRGEDSMISHYARYTLQTSTTRPCIEAMTHDEPRLIRYVAGRSVTLNEGFTVKPGSDFIARIDECLLDAPYYKPNKTQLVEEGQSGGATPEELLTWRIYPNPTHGEFILEADDPSSEKQVRVVNTMGKTVYTRDLSRGTVYSIDLGSLPAGIYFVKLTIDQLTQTKRLVIQ